MKKTIAQRMSEMSVKCFQCCSHMVLRRNRKTGNEFYGCSRFPECMNTMSTRVMIEDEVPYFDSDDNGNFIYDWYYDEDQYLDHPIFGW